MSEPLVERMRGFGTTVFSEMTALALAHDAINLGQGFPDFAPPPGIAEGAVRAIEAGRNQYAPGIGVRTLRRAIATHQKRFQGLDYDADDEVTVTAGATEAVCAAVLALCEPGFDVVLFEPYYDSYAANVAMAGGVRRCVTLRAPDFALDPSALEAAVGPRTRVLLLNSPHNPSGKVFSDDELAAVARVCVERDLIAVTDEVYEHLVYEGAHRSLASFPGMRERTLVISSAGKTFSVTGWKVGWACGPPALTAALRATKQFMTFTNGTPFQHAIAPALGWDDTFFATLADDFRARRDRLVGGLRSAGIEVVSGAGTYFVCVDARSLGYDDGLTACRELPARAGVAAVPFSAFYDDADAGRSLVRLAFCKADSVLDEGIARLRAHVKAVRA